MNVASRQIMLQNINSNHFKERRLQYLRNHQEIFDVDPNFYDNLFESFILEIEDFLSVTLSCNVEGDRLLARRYEVVPFNQKSWPFFLADTFKFLDRIDRLLGVHINRDLFEQFAAAYIGSQKIVDNTVGIHLGTKLEDSCIRLCIHFDPEKDCEELTRTAIALDGGHYSDELTQVLIRDMVVIRFELFFDGRSYLVLGPAAPGCAETYGNRGNFLTPYIQKHFSQKVNSIFRGSYLTKVSFSKVYATPVLAFYFKNLKDIPKYFRFNSLGDRILGFCQSHSCLRFAVVVVTEAELENSRIENFNFYYARHE